MRQVEVAHGGNSVRASTVTGASEERSVIPGRLGLPGHGSLGIRGVVKPRDGSLLRRLARVRSSTSGKCWLPCPIAN